MPDEIYHKEYLKRRTVKAYPPEPVINMLNAYCEITKDSKSEFISDAIREKLLRQPEILQEQIKKQSRNTY